MDPLGNERGADGIVDDRVTGGGCTNSSSFIIRTESWVTDFKQNVCQIYNYTAMTTRNLEVMTSCSGRGCKRQKSGT